MIVAALPDAKEGHFVRGNYGEKQGRTEGGLLSSKTSGVPRYAALKHRNFVLLWSGLIASNVGTWVQDVAEGWLVLQLTNSPLWLGMLGLSFALPMVFLPIVGGAVVDRGHRVRLLYLTPTAQL